MLARRSEVLVVRAVGGGGTRCVRGMVLVSRRACAGALVLAGIVGEVRRLGGVKAVGLPVCEKKYRRVGGGRVLLLLPLLLRRWLRVLGLVFVRERRDGLRD